MCSAQLKRWTETKKGRSLSIGKSQQSVSDLAQNIPAIGTKFNDVSVIANRSDVTPQCRENAKFRALGLCTSLLGGLFFVQLLRVRVKNMTIKEPIREQCDLPSR